MFGLDFLFAAALWALPLAGLPILLHLLFRHKSPVIPFSTLRFVKLTVQRTAARRRLQKWLLLACRALLVALLIWAIAQPAKKLGNSWFGGSRSTVAAIVIDCSYSMQLQDNQQTLLARADGIVQDLLHGQLAGANVAIFRSEAAPAQAEELRDASAILAEWSPLQPQPNPRPLVDRVTAAVALLDRQPAEQKWLVVLSDFQSREFGRPIADAKGARVALIDLHPPESRSAGVTSVSITPQQPLPGIASEAVVQVTGRPGESRAVLVKSTALDGTILTQTPPAMANLDAGGRATVRFPLKLPANRYVLLQGTLTADDAAMWDNTRAQLVEIPTKQTIALLAQTPSTPAERFVKLALDPSEGKLTEWPLTVRVIAAPSAADNAAVAVLSRWPDAGGATALRDFARSGHNLVLFLQPGLEDTWAALPAAVKDALGELLPSAPTPHGSDAIAHVVITDPQSPLLEGLTDQRFQLTSIAVRSAVQFAAAGTASTILSIAPTDPAVGSRPHGLLFRKPVGAGVCYTIATTPDARFTNFATHPVFLPILVRMVLPSAQQSTAQNVELGQPLALRGSAAANQTELQIETPQREQYRVKASEGAAGHEFVFAQANAPGVYRWQRVGDVTPIALTNVQLPAAESELTYRAAKEVAPGPDAVVATSVADLNAKLATLNEPEPRWSAPIAIVLVLLCVEALMGSLSKAGRGMSSGGSRAFAPVPTA